MVDYVWFRILGKMPDLAHPYYLGHGLAFNAKYNIRDVWQEPMPDHVVVKICLTRGGAVGTAQQKRMLKAGSVILRFVEDTELWEGYHPSHRGDWEFLGLIFTGQSGVEAARALMERYGRVYQLGLDHLIIKRLMNLARQSETVTEVTASAGARLVNDVLLALLESAEATELERDGHLINLAESVENTLRSDLRREWSVAQLASLHRVTREHLTRTFTRRYGISPHRYLVQLRVNEACRMLRTTDASIKRIMLDLGFGSHASFVRTFRRYTHSSPTAYRQQESSRRR
jgi:AraC-like DNA-binding protein